MAHDLIKKTKLSANLKGSKSQTLEQLQVSIPNEAAIDALACLNMISVGIDIGRLGLMIVESINTAEYIRRQAGLAECNCHRV